MYGVLVGFKVSSELPETEGTKTEFGALPVLFRMVWYMVLFRIVESDSVGNPGVMAARPWRNSDEFDEGSTRPQPEAIPY